MGLQLIKGHGLGLILRIEGQVETQLVKGGHETAHDIGINVDHQVDRIAAAFGFVNLMGIDNGNVVFLKVQLTVFKVTGDLACHKHQQLHRLVPVGRDIGAEVIFIFDSKSGLIDVRQDPVLVTLH